MKKYSALFLLIIFCITTQHELFAQRAMRVLLGVKINLEDYSSGDYAGEVNSNNQPEGYGYCLFADSMWYAGQFLAGHITGEGLLINKNSKAVTIAKWEDGQLTGQYFKKGGKSLGIGVSTANHKRPPYLSRLCSFYDKYIINNVYSDTAFPSASKTTFILNKNEWNNVSVLYGQALDKNFQFNGNYLSYNSTNGKIDLQKANDGVYTGAIEQDGHNINYDFLDNNLNYKLQTYFTNPLPAWLQGADFRQRDDNKEKFFRRSDSNVPAWGSYTMQYGSDAGTAALLRICNLNSMLQPTGFMQEIVLSKGNIYRYIMGDIHLTKGDNGGHIGNGIAMQFNNDNEEFYISAGQLQSATPEEPERKQMLHSGVQLAYYAGTFSITIGDWDANNNIGKGYNIELNNGTIWRGDLRLNIPEGLGEFLTQASGKVLKENTIEKKVVTDVPVFKDISKPALFDKIFNIKMD